MNVVLLQFFLLSDNTKFVTKPLKTQRRCLHEPEGEHRQITLIVEMVQSLFHNKGFVLNNIRKFIELHCCS